MKRSQPVAMVPQLSLKATFEKKKIECTSKHILKHISRATERQWSYKEPKCSLRLRTLPSVKVQVLTAVPGPGPACPALTSSGLLAPSFRSQLKCHGARERSRSPREQLPLSSLLQAPAQAALAWPDSRARPRPPPPAAAPVCANTSARSVCLSLPRQTTSCFSNSQKSRLALSVRVPLCQPAGLCLSTFQGLCRLLGSSPPLTPKGAPVGGPAPLKAEKKLTEQRERAVNKRCGCWGGVSGWTGWETWSEGQGGRGRAGGVGGQTSGQGQALEAGPQRPRLPCLFGAALQMGRGMRGGEGPWADAGFCESSNSGRRCASHTL